MNDNQVQKLSDEALDEVTGGIKPDGTGMSKGQQIWFNDEVRPFIVYKSLEVRRGGKDPDIAWRECEE